MSLRTRRPVTTDLGDYLPATIELAFFGMLLAGIIGVGLGLLTALRVRGSGAVRFGILGLASRRPSCSRCSGYCSSTEGSDGCRDRAHLDRERTDRTDEVLVLDASSRRLDVVVDALKHLVLPAFCVAIVPACSIGRVLRSSLVARCVPTTFVPHGRRDCASREWSASTRCATRSVRHLSMAGLQVGLMFAGVIVVEQVFALAGHRSVHRAEHPHHRLSGDPRE